MLYIYIYVYIYYNILYIYTINLAISPGRNLPSPDLTEPRSLGAPWNFRPRFAVIENEFGAVPIDNELLANSVPILQGLGSVGIGLVMGWAHIYIYIYIYTFCLRNLLFLGLKKKTYVFLKKHRFWNSSIFWYLHLPTYSQTRLSKDAEGMYRMTFKLTMMHLYLRPRVPELHDAAR